MQDQPESDQLEKERLALEAERAALEAERTALRAARAASDAGAGGQADTGIGTGRLVRMIVGGFVGYFGVSFSDCSSGLFSAG